jgi:transposase-like protein
LDSIDAFLQRLEDLRRQSQVRKFHLSRGEKAGLRRIARTDPNPRVALRAQALLLLEEGKSVTEVARTCKVSRETVYNWLKRWERTSGGVRKRLWGGR